MDEVRVQTSEGWDASPGPLSVVCRVLAFGWKAEVPTVSMTPVGTTPTSSSPRGMVPSLQATLPQRSLSSSVSLSSFFKAGY